MKMRAHLPSAFQTDTLCPLHANGRFQSIERGKAGRDPFGGGRVFTIIDKLDFPKLLYCGCQFINGTLRVFEK